MQHLTIAVAVSGGADSLYALLSLHRAGHTVMAVHGLFLPTTSAQTPVVQELRHLCAAYGIAFHTIDLRDHFDQKVISPFIHSYIDGTTPNPCALCNAHIKFGALLDAARALGATHLATGHYARVHSADDGSVMLQQAVDGQKDQSYFLALVPPERLRQALFPLADITKKEVIQTLRAWGVAVPLPAESQDICFIPHNAYREFLQHEASQRQLTLGTKGPMILYADTPQERVLGTHEGLWNYTEGQRRGLHIAYTEPLFVAHKDAQRNALLLATKDALGVRYCQVTQCNTFIPPEHWEGPLLARLRYRQIPSPVTAEYSNTDIVTLHFGTAQSPTAPGQIAAVYDTRGRVLAGGIISRTGNKPLA